MRQGVDQWLPGFEKERENREWLLNACGVSFGSGENVLELESGEDSQFNEYTKTTEFYILKWHIL